MRRHTHDFIELDNPTDAAPSACTGWSRPSDRSATSTSPATTGANSHRAYRLRCPLAATTWSRRRRCRRRRSPFRTPDATGHRWALPTAAGRSARRTTTSPLDPVDGDCHGGYRRTGDRRHGRGGNDSASFEKATADERHRRNDARRATRTGTDATPITTPTTSRRRAPTPTNSRRRGRGADRDRPRRRDGYVGLPIDPITLAASGGTPPYSWDIGRTAGRSLRDQRRRDRRHPDRGGLVHGHGDGDRLGDADADRRGRVHDHREPGAPAGSRSPRSRATARPPTWSATR